MIIILRNIPRDTLRSNIVLFVKPVVKGGLFSKKGKIKRVELLALKDKHTHLLEYHALIDIEPDAVASRAIKKLHGQRFKDRRIAVRQYFERSPKNNKRIGPSEPHAVLREKRFNPTRRRELEIEEIWPRYF